MTNSSTTKPVDYEEICKKIHEIHCEQSGTTIPELVEAYVEAHPKPTEEEVKNIVLTYPWVQREELV